MIVTLLISTFLISLAVVTIVVLFFRRPVDAILERVIGEPIGHAWSRYLLFTLYVFGIGGGVRVWQLERYLDPQGPPGASPLVLNSDRWVLEIYQTIISTLQSMSMVLFFFFLVALIALVIVRAGEARRPRP